jgi:hypothetical protein
VPFVKMLSVLVMGALVTLAGCGHRGASHHAHTSKSEPFASAPFAQNDQGRLAPDFLTYRIAAAKKIMQANREHTFAGDLPEQLASIPVLEISLHSDGSVRSIEVLRKPHFFPESIELAKAAVRRAAPFGSVAHLPKPWVFNETFLYNDALTFQLHSLQP